MGQQRQARTLWATTELEIGSFHAISEVYSSIGIITPLPLLGGFQCDTVCGQFCFLVSKTSPNVRHPWPHPPSSLDFEGRLWAIFLLSIFLEYFREGPKSVWSGRNLRLLFQYNLLPESIDFKAKPNPWEEVTFAQPPHLCTLPPKPLELKLSCGKAWPHAFTPC